MELVNKEELSDFDDLSRKSVSELKRILEQEKVEKEKRDLINEIRRLRSGMSYPFQKDYQY